MILFSIKTTSEKKIIGTEYPQIQTMGGTVDKNAPDSLYNVYSDAFPNFIPNLNYFILHKNAKLTDVLSTAMISYGFVLNDKVKKILEQFKLPPHKFYPAIVEHKGTFYENYHWFFYICDVLDFIDYNKTKFFITDLVNNKLEDCKNITSSNSLKNVKDVLTGQGYINADIIYLKKDITFAYDLLEITFGNYRTYISEKLNDAFKKDGIIGFNIAPANKITI